MYVPVRDNHPRRTEVFRYRRWGHSDCPGVFDVCAGLVGQHESKCDSTEKGHGRDEPLEDHTGSASDPDLDIMM